MAPPLRPTVYERQAPDPRAVEQALAGSRLGVFWLEDAPTLTTNGPLIAPVRGRAGSEAVRVYENVKRSALTEMAGVLSGFWGSIEEQVRLAALAGHDYSANQDDRVAILALHQAATAGPAVTLLTVVVPAVLAVAVMTAMALRLPARKPSPFWGRAGDIADIMLIISLLPLAFGLLGLYSWLRGLAG